MKKFYYSTDSEDIKQAFALVEADSAHEARIFLHEKFTGDIKFTPLNRKPPRAEFYCEASNPDVSWAAKPAKVKTGAGRPKGSCKPVELRRVSHTLTVLPKTKANLLKLNRGVVGAKLDELYG
tara:strand:+ start:2148 stop:2516 length:369 start_codon:yes stop_codon:yes gene_type:complete